MGGRVNAKGFGVKGSGADGGAGADVNGGVRVDVRVSAGVDAAARGVWSSVSLSLVLALTMGSSSVLYFSEIVCDEAVFC